MDGALHAGLKALHSEARKRAAVAAGIGAYLYTALEPVVLPIGPIRAAADSNCKPSHVGRSHDHLRWSYDRQPASCA